MSTVSGSWAINPELVTIGERPTGHRVRHSFGPMRGVSARALGTMRSLGTAWDANFAGEMTGYAATCDEAREVALQRLLVAAAQVGANAVTHLRFDSETVGEVVCFLAYGMACIAEPKAPDAG